jgi:hypothetical protein
MLGGTEGRTVTKAERPRAKTEDCVRQSSEGFFTSREQATSGNPPEFYLNLLFIYLSLYFIAHSIFNCRNIVGPIFKAYPLIENNNVFTASLPE